ncbi:MAG TPA: dienelactone hydrolase family protein [Polyangiaceae bacterium]|nr:dienelactone hydrolase family protein [Polyangiaceae bacterium]
MADSDARADDPSRRRLLAGAAGAGFALAVQPVSAETITTSAAGLDAADVKIPTSSGDIPAYRAAPAEKKNKPHPLVLVVHEIFGVHEHIRDLCRRLAKQGYYAVAPDLFVRQGDVTKLEGFDQIRKIVDVVPDAQILSDLDATVAWATHQAGADPSKLAITGFCWGGRVVWLYAAHRKDLKAGVAWYGRLSGEQSHYRPRQPLDVGAELNAPVLGLYGGKDQGIPQTDVEAMKKVLAGGNAAARASEFVVYPQAGHAFNADYRPSYDPHAAADGWRRMLAWFKKHGA